ncbi:SMP-30/Gluconolaconase/LRE-like region [Ostertagia ostertagi]
MNIIIMTMQCLISLCSLFAAMIVSFGPASLKPLVSRYQKWGFGRIAQAAGHWLVFVATLAGIMVPFLAFFASCIAFVSSIPPLLAALTLKTPRAWTLPAILLIAPCIVAIAQPLGLKVLALPKADDLRFNPVLSRVIKTYDEGCWFEGIAAGDDGTLYLSGNRGLDFSRTDYYHDAKGELIARKPDGSEHVIFRTPGGLSAGVPVVAADNTIYLTSHGDSSFIWHLDSMGKVMERVKLPKAAWPNGLAMGPDGMLYSADSFLGVIWRVATKTGHIEEALRDPALLARPFIALAPGANGLHFNNRDLLVTVSDRTTVLRYSLDDQGHFGTGAVITRGIPGDDFAMGKDGSLFITTHPYNTVVRVSPGGARTIIAEQAQNITGATDAVFGKTGKDRDILYVVTDGGAFNAGKKTRGNLIALAPYSRQ